VLDIHPVAVPTSQSHGVVASIVCVSVHERVGLHFGVGGGGDTVTVFVQAEDVYDPSTVHLGE
jgi:hypothetical protein